MNDFKVIDHKGQEVAVGSQVIYGERPEAEKGMQLFDTIGIPSEDYHAVVVSISEPDYDMDDELGRAVEYCPKIEIRFSNGEVGMVNTYNVTQYTWNDYPDGPTEYVYQADDIEVAP